MKICWKPLTKYLNCHTGVHQTLSTIPHFPTAIFELNVIESIIIFFSFGALRHHTWSMLVMFSICLSIQNLCRRTYAIQKSCHDSYPAHVLKFRCVNARAKERDVPRNGIPLFIVWKRLRMSTHFWTCGRSFVKPKRTSSRAFEGNPQDHDTPVSLIRCFFSSLSCWRGKTLLYKRERMCRKNRVPRLIGRRCSPIQRWERTCEKRSTSNFWKAAITINTKKIGQGARGSCHVFQLGK